LYNYLLEVLASLATRVEASEGKAGVINPSSNFLFTMGRYL